VRPIYAHISPLNPNPHDGFFVSYVAGLDCGDSPTGVVVTLGSGNPSLAWISNPSQGFITIPAGQTTGFFTVSTAPVSAQVTVDITATANGHTEARHLVIIP
jgi:hypothetical protein